MPKQCTGPLILMADATVPAIFEAAFEHEGIRIRVDVLERLESGAWGLREVKSSASMKGHHADDLALQLFVLAGAGIAISSIELVHVNRAYVRGPDGHLLAGVLHPRRCRRGGEGGARRAARPDARHAGVPEPRRTSPHAEPGKQCGTPYGCEFWDRCTADKPAGWS